MRDSDTLIQHYVEGLLTEEEAGELAVLIDSDPALAERLLSHLHVDEMLRSTKPLVALPSYVSTVVKKSRFSGLALFSAAALAACLTLLATWGVRSVGAGAEEATTTSVAVMSRGVDVVWDQDSMKPAPGAPLAPGWLRLKSGLAQIEFYQGARVSIEGPAVFRLISSGEAFCEKGRLSAHVPPQAKGFRIDTPKGAIVDLGTAFGLDVSDGGAEVHVFEGEVELHTRDAEMKSLKEGQAMAMQRGAGVQAARQSSFSTLTEIDQRTAAVQRADFQSWLALAPARNAERDLKLRFDFQDGSETRSLRNHAAGEKEIADGSIVGCSWTQGRWPGKQALEFRNVSDRVRIVVPGDLKAMTLATWVRVGGLDRPLSGLFMSEGWGNRKVHWQITRDGAVRLGVAGEGTRGHSDYDSPNLFSAEILGRWMHLAVVYDSEKREVRHYANGEITARLPLKDFFPLRIGTAELGNWNDQTKGSRVAIRHLSGIMDEFSLYSRALSDWEIGDLSR